MNESRREPRRHTKPQPLRIPHLNPLKAPRFFIALVALLLAGLASRARPQQVPQPLSPSEALRWAMDPFNQARSQNGDLTDADKLALSLGETRASQNCLSLTSTSASAPLEPAELLALGKLCLFGQQFEPARATLVQYLARPSLTDRETALVLLTRAFLGLKSPGSAAIQVLSLFRDFPYDAQIHSTADQAIGANQVMPPLAAAYALPLCKKQAAATLPLLLAGKSLESKDETITAARLFADALRCSMLARQAGTQIPDDSLDDLKSIAQQPVWQGSADLPLMQQAMARAKMVGQAVPMRALHLRPFSSRKPPTPRALPLHHGTIVLAFFTMWSPSAIDAIQNLANAAPSAVIYAVTSWRANTGGNDEPSPELLPSLRTMSQALPRRVALLVVPDAELNAFHVDQFPAAVAIGDGIVLSNVVLADQGGISMALAGIHPAPSVRRSNSGRQAR